MENNRQQTFLSVCAVMATILFLTGTATANKDKNKNKDHDFGNVNYLFGPTARQAHDDNITGESVKGQLYFDAEAKILLFNTYVHLGEDSGGDGYCGRCLKIPYAKIHKLSEENQSKARTGSWAIGAGAGALFIRKHKHFLLIEYTDEKDNNRSALLQLDKGIYKDVLKTAEKDTGFKIEK